MSFSLELEVLDLKLPALTYLLWKLQLIFLNTKLLYINYNFNHIPCNATILLDVLTDFSKVKCILSANGYTQSLSYPFNTMDVPKIDEFSVLEISITHMNQLIAGIEVPLTLFKQHKPQTFKLTDLLSPPDKRSLFSNKQLKNNNNEITLLIRQMPLNKNIEDYKQQIKQLEMRIKESDQLVEKEHKNRKELQSHFEDITKKLSEMVKGQDDAIENLLGEKERIKEYLATVESEFKSEKPQPCPSSSKLKSSTSHKFFLKTCEKLSGQKKTYTKAHYKSIDPPSKSLFTERGPSISAELESLKSTIERLEKEKQSALSENQSLRQTIFDLKKKLEDRETKLSEVSVSTSLDRAQRQQTSESVVLGVRGEIAKATSKYKKRISRLVDVKNDLIIENQKLTQKLKEFEEKRSVDVSKEPAIDRPRRQRSCKILGRFAGNSVNLERVEKKDDSFMKYINKTIGGRVENKIEKIYTESQLESLEFALSEYLASVKNQLEVKFIKDHDGFYFFGSKRVFLKVNSEGLSVKVAGTFMAIDDFVKVFTPMELQKSQKTQEASDPSLSYISQRALPDRTKSSEPKTTEIRQSSITKLSSKPSSFTND